MKRRPLELVEEGAEAASHPVRAREPVVEQLVVAALPFEGDGATFVSE